MVKSIIESGAGLFRVDAASLIEPLAATAEELRSITEEVSYC